MEYSFTKLHGTGNDFIFFGDFAQELELNEAQVTSLCDRHIGIGADGVILVRPSDNPECSAYMHYINADGSLAQMCGNGARCFAKYLVDRGFVETRNGCLKIDTLSGVHIVAFETDEHNKLVSATVNMGQPILKPAEIPTLLAVSSKTEGIDFVGDTPIATPWGDFQFTCVSMGNPHAVCFLSDFDTIDNTLFPDSCDKSLETLDIDRIGSFIEHHEMFPEQVNVEFATVLSKTSIAMRVFERGVGETLACGTGACATTVAASLTGRAKKMVDIHLLGGLLHIEWCADGDVLMTGPAQEVFQGTIDIA